VVACVATVGFLTSWTLLHQSFWGRHQLVDTPLYEAYADAIRAGDVPYRDFAIEYPPGALPVSSTTRGRLASRSAPSFGARARPLHDLEQMGAREVWRGMLRGRVGAGPRMEEAGEDDVVAGSGSAGR